MWLTWEVDTSAGDSPKKSKTIPIGLKSRNNWANILLEKRYSFNGRINLKRLSNNNSLCKRHAVMKATTAKTNIWVIDPKTVCNCQTSIQILSNILEQISIVT